MQQWKRIAYSTGFSKTDNRKLLWVLSRKEGIAPGVREGRCPVIGVGVYGKRNKEEIQSQELYIRLVSSLCFQDPGPPDSWDPCVKAAAQSQCPCLEQLLHETLKAMEFPGRPRKKVLRGRGNKNCWCLSPTDCFHSDQSFSYRDLPIR